MKNKGQVLVLFVLLLPIFLLILLISIEFGKLYTDKIKTKNIIEDTIEYGMKNINDQEINVKLNNLLENNIKDINNKTVFISEDEIRINLTQNKEIFGKKIIIKYEEKKTIIK